MVAIYKITSPSGKVYIGQSRRIKDRFAYYKALRTKDQPKLHNSFLKYGVDKHIFELVHELPSDVDQNVLNTYEILYMDLYRSVGIELLNLKEGGSNGKAAPETIEKLRLLRLGTKYSSETKAKISNSHKNKKKSPSHVENMRKANIGKILSKEHKNNIKKGNKRWHAEIGFTKEDIYKFSKPVIQYSKSGEKIKEWKSISDAARELNSHVSNISRACRNPNKKFAAGFMWKYPDSTPEK